MRDTVPGALDCESGVGAVPFVGRIISVDGINSLRSRHR